MRNPSGSNHHFDFSFPYFPVGNRVLTFSDEIEAQRRRKGSGPEGRAEAPVRREGEGGGTSGGSAGGGGLGSSSGGGGLLPSLGGGRGGGIKLPSCIVMIIVVVLLI